MRRKKLKISIIGAGIGGTTAAALLQKAGYECKVYEQAPEFSRIGAGINLAPNSTRVFRAMGLERKMLRTGLQPRVKVNLKWDTGHEFYRVPVPKLTDVYGAPFMAFHRGDLHDLLTSAVAPGTFQLGKRFMSLAHCGTYIRLNFEDGTTVDTDAVIGADGLHSRVRQEIFGKEPLIYTGRVAYRSIIPRKLLDDLKLPDNARWWGETNYVLTYFLREARDEVNLVTGGPEDWKEPNYTPMPVSPDRLRAAFPGFHSQVQQILRACTDVSCWPLLVRAPGRPWSKGPVTLLGDACHPMVPNMGQGGGMAIEDAVLLVRCLEYANQGEDPEHAFQLYEVNRIERTSMVQNESQKDQLTSGEMDHKWLFGYDALTVPIKSLASSIHKHSNHTTH